MAKTMTASQHMTDGQIEAAVGQFRAAMRKHRSTIRKDVAQQALGVPNLGMILFDPFRRQVEVLTNIIIRTVTVDLIRTPYEALTATGRRRNVDALVIATMPRGQGGPTEVIFFRLTPEEYTRPGEISDDDLKRAFERRELEPADPYTLAAANEADPTFADEHPNGTHWRDANGRWCHAAFRLLDHLREVFVYHHYPYHWSDIWWFAGVRKHK